MMRQPEAGRVGSGKQISRGRAIVHRQSRKMMVGETEVLTKPSVAST